MKKNIRQPERSNSEDSERMKEYWNDDREEVDQPWDARKTGRQKSKSKGRAKNNRRRLMTDPERDEYVGDSDLE